jgi:hypothetical protein
VFKTKAEADAIKIILDWGKAHPDAMKNFNR